MASGRAFQDSKGRGMSTKAARGTKRTCQSCNGRFYDLNRDPIECPLCGATYALDHGAPKDEPEPEDVHEEEAETGEAEDAAELTGKEEEVVDKEAPKVSEEDDLADIETDDADIDSSDDEDVFLEEEVDGEPDVTGIIGGPIKEDDEEG